MRKQANIITIIIIGNLTKEIELIMTTDLHQGRYL